MNDTLMRAMLFAEFAHRKQSREYNPEPYIVHPRRVAAHAARLGLSDNAIAAAFLHDVLEDTKTKEHELRSSFSTEIVDMVVALSDMQKPDEASRAVRKKRYHQKLIDYMRVKEKELLPAAHPDHYEVLTLKALDCIDNARSLAGEAPEFWKVVRQEMAEFLHDFGDYMHPKAKKSFRKYLED